MTREIWKILSQYAVDFSTFPVNDRYSHLFAILEGFLSRNDKPRDIWNMHGISGNVFVNPPASSSSRLPGGLNLWIPNGTEDTSPHVTSGRRSPDKALDPRCQSGLSAWNSFDPKEGKFSKDSVEDQQRLQISDLHFDKFPTQILDCWKIMFKTEVCTCSRKVCYGSNKEVEMVESVDDLKSSRSIGGALCPDLSYTTKELLHHWTKSCRKPSFKKKVSLQEMKAHNEDRFLRGRQIAYLIYDYFRVTWANDSVDNLQTHSELFFELMIFRNSIRNETKFYCPWQKSHLMISWEACTN